MAENRLETSNEEELAELLNLPNLEDFSSIGRLTSIRRITENVPSFFYKDPFYRNVEAEI